MNLLKLIFKKGVSVSKSERKIAEKVAERYSKGNSKSLFGRRRCANIIRNVVAVAPSVRERSSLAYGPVVPEEHNNPRSITPRAIISSFQKPSPVLHRSSKELPPSRDSTSPSDCTRHACPYRDRVGVFEYALLRCTCSRKYMCKQRGPDSFK